MAESAPAFKKGQIFVQIPSYRDTETQWTLKDLFEKAKHPERIFVGVCWQVIPELDQDCFLFEVRPDQVRNKFFHAKDARGYAWACHEAQLLWDGEEYTLETDAHMRFEQDWDEKLIAMLQQCESDKPILTTCCPGYTPPNTIEHRFITRIAPKAVVRQGITCGNSVVYEKPERPFPSAVFFGGLTFSHSSRLLESPIDPNIAYYAADIIMSIRAWTHGWDIFHITEPILYHYYEQNRKTGEVKFSNPMYGSSYAYKRLDYLLGLDTQVDDPFLLRDIEKYGLGRSRSLAEYEQFFGINFFTKSLTENAKKGIFPLPKTLPSTKLAAQAKNEEIFVHIASYRDPECQWTIKDLFEKAKHPERIRVGVCWQFIPELDQGCFLFESNADRVKFINIHAQDSIGLGWARHKVQQLWNGEKYALQLDAHMRFVQDWDEKMIKVLGMCRSAKPVITSPPPPYSPPYHYVTNYNPAINVAGQFNDQKALRHQGKIMRPTPDRPLLGAFVSGNFMFSRAEVMQDVPASVYLYLGQEEVNLSARLYTSGWDVFHPHEILLYHYYQVKEYLSVDIPKHWQDNKNRTKMRDKFAKESYLHLFEIEKSSNPEILEYVSKYGMGLARSFAQYQEFCGVDFGKQKVSDKAAKGLFDPDGANYLS